MKISFCYPIKKLKQETDTQEKYDFKALLILKASVFVIKC